MHAGFAHGGELVGAREFEREFFDRGRVVRDGDFRREALRLEIAELEIAAVERHPARHRFVHQLQCAAAVEMAAERLAIRGDAEVRQLRHLDGKLAVDRRGGGVLEIARHLPGAVRGHGVFRAAHVKRVERDERVVAGDAQLRRIERESVGAQVGEVGGHVAVHCFKRREAGLVDALAGFDGQLRGGDGKFSEREFRRVEREVGAGHAAAQRDGAAAGDAAGERLGEHGGERGEVWRVEPERGVEVALGEVVH